MTCPECGGALAAAKSHTFTCRTCGMIYRLEGLQDVSGGCCGQDFDDRDFEFDYGKPFPEEVC